MGFQKVFEVLEDALRTKDMMIDVYKQERDTYKQERDMARIEAVNLRHKIAVLEGSENAD